MTSGYYPNNSSGYSHMDMTPASDGSPPGIGSDTNSFGGSSIVRPYLKPIPNELSTSHAPQFSALDTRSHHITSSPFLGISLASDSVYSNIAQPAQDGGLYELDPCSDPRYIVPQQYVRTAAQGAGPTTDQSAQLEDLCMSGGLYADPDVLRRDPVTTFHSRQTHMHSAFISSESLHSSLDHLAQMHLGTSPYSTPIVRPMPGFCESYQQNVPSDDYSSEGVKRSFPLSTFPFPFGPSVPQRTYRPRGNEKDLDRNTQASALLEPIYFWRDSICGLPLVDILNNTIGNLLNPNEPVFQGAKQSASIRVKWPGYSGWSKQICTMNYRKERGYISRKKAAQLIAKTLRIFFAEVNKGKVGKKAKYFDQRLGDLAMDDWTIAPNHTGIGWKDIVLISLQNVSQGSWQPELCLRYPRPHLEASSSGPSAINVTHYS